MIVCSSVFMEKQSFENFFFYVLALAQFLRAALVLFWKKLSEVHGRR